MIDFKLLYKNLSFKLDSYQNVHEYEKWNTKNNLNTYLLFSETKRISKIILHQLSGTQDILKKMKGNFTESIRRYEDFAQMFKADKFDPEKWAELFVKSGARFV